MIKYLYEAINARLSDPMAINTYVDKDEISKKTKVLNASPVIVTPSNPATHSK